MKRTFAKRTPSVSNRAEANYKGFRSTSGSAITPPFTIAVVGRPNVGKSSLFNALLGYRRTIVLDQPGTTMDDVLERVDWTEEPLALVDSQGIFNEGDKTVLDRLLAKSSACIFVVDAISGPTPFDRWIATLLKVSRKPVLLCVNKVESGKSHGESDFAQLGFDDTLSVSAAHRLNLSAIKEWCVAHVETESLQASESEEKTVEEAAPKPMKLALIGRPNSGKSTLMNFLCQSDVSRVSPEPHTTRDPVSFEMDTPQGRLRLIDTAGMRRPRSKKDLVEVFSIQATTRTIREADVTLLLLNASEPVADQDMRLLNLLERQGKPAAVLLNFWDLLSSSARKKFFEETEFANYIQNFRTLPISGLTGFNIKECFPLAFRLHKTAQRRVKTSRLNQVVERIIAKNPPPSAGRQNFNILYASQVRVDPPTFVFFMNRKAALPSSYQKYLENQLRSQLGFKGQAIRIQFRGQKD